MNELELNTHYLSSAILQNDIFNLTASRDLQSSYLAIPEGLFTLLYYALHHA